MGAVVSLSLAAAANVRERVTQRFSRSSKADVEIQSQTSAASRSATVQRESGVVEISTSAELDNGGAAVVLDDANPATVTVSIEKKRRTTRPRNTGPRQPYHADVGKILCSKLLMMQLIFNMFSSIVCSLGLFSFLFAFLDWGPYEWYHPNCLGVILGSSFICSPTLVMILAPAGLPEAVDKKWFFVLRHSDLTPWQRWLMPFLAMNPCLRKGLVRHLVCGLCISTIMVPVPLLLAAFVFSDASGKFATWELIWFNIGFETVLAIPCTAFGLLGFAHEPNYLRVRATMSMHPNQCTRLYRRIIGCIKLLC